MIDKCINEFKSDINSCLNDTKVTLTKYLSDVELKVNKLNEVISQLEVRIDHLERDKISKDVKLFGIPELKHVTPFMIYQRICSYLEFPYTDSPQIKQIFRLPYKSNKKSVKSPPILIKFKTIPFKNQFMTAFINSRITLENIGFSLDTQIYCNNSLTAKKLEV